MLLFMKKIYIKNILFSKKMLSYFIHIIKNTKIIKYLDIFKIFAYSISNKFCLNKMEGII